MAMAAAALSLTLGALAAPASAATQNSASGAQTTLFKVTASRGTDTLVAHSEVGTLTNQSVSPDFTACPVSSFGYSGEAICGTLELHATPNPNSGVDEDFIIGLDWSIWHAWPGSNGWHSLGGQALHQTPNGVGSFPHNPFLIDTIGTDGNRYCRVWPWTSGWVQC